MVPWFIELNSFQAAEVCESKPAQIKTYLI